MAQTQTIDSLPNEILMHILEFFPTRSLLPLSPTSRRLSALVSRVYYARLLDAVTLVEHDLILKCYHPSAKISTPYLFCDYLGTDGLDIASSKQTAGMPTTMTPSVAAINAMYSRFRPVLNEEDRRPHHRAARYQPHSIINVDGEAAAARDEKEATAAVVDPPSQDINLDACELFSQLCTAASLVKTATSPPRRGLYLGHVPIADGVIRVWRHWLACEAARPPAAAVLEGSVLWADAGMNVGVRMRVSEKEGMAAPVLVGPGDEPPVSYSVEFEELLVRSNQLILSKEQAAQQQVTQSVPLSTLMASRPPHACDAAFAASSTPQFSFQTSPGWYSSAHHESSSRHPFLTTRDQALANMRRRASATTNSSGGGASSSAKYVAATSLALATRAIDSLAADLVDAASGVRDLAAVPVLLGAYVAHRCGTLLFGHGT